VKNPKPKGYDVQSKQYYPQCADQEMEAGTSIFTALDEKAALKNMVESVPVVYGDDLQSIDGGGEDI
jgi:hypothetical protein